MKNLFTSIIALYTCYVNAQLLNGNFETLVTDTDQTTGQQYQSPEYWDLHNLGGEVNNDSYSGNYAVKIWSWYYGQSNTTLEYLENIEIEDLSNRPTQLRGFYKFTKVNEHSDNTNLKDSAYVEVLMTKYNEGLQQRDTIAYNYKCLAPQNSYVPFEMGISYQNNSIPDTLHITFKSSYFGWPWAIVNGTITNGESNYLQIDNLSLENTLSIHEFEIEKIIKIYPNPAIDNIIVETSGFNLSSPKLYTLQGKEVKLNYKQSNEGFIFNVSGLASGIYLLELKTINHQKVIKKLVIK